MHLQQCRSDMASSCRDAEHGSKSAQSVPTQWSVYRCSSAAQDQDALVLGSSGCNIWMLLDRGANWPEIRDAEVGDHRVAVGLDCGP